MNAAKFLAALVRTSLALVALSVVSISAQAQDTEPAAVHKWAVKAGAFFPTNGTLRSQSGTPQMSLGVDYNPNFRYHLHGGTVSFGGELIYRENSGKKYLTIPVVAKVTWDLVQLMEGKFRVYGGVGGGAYFINTGFIGGTTQPGAQFVLGANLNERLFVELNYNYVSGFSDNLGNSVRVDGLNFYIGTRF